MTIPTGTPTGGVLRLADGPTVGRLGYGAMQLPGPGVWGPPRDRGTALAVLRRAVEAGVTHIDTSDFYGPHVANDLIREALHPYPGDLVIATKVGVVRDEWKGFDAAAEPEQLRGQVEENLVRLGKDRLDLVYLRVGGDGLLFPGETPFAESFGALADLRRRGLIRNLGLSGVTTAQLAEARAIAPVAAVQNRFHVFDRSSADVLAACEADGIAFTAYFPLAAGMLRPGLDLSQAPPGMAPTAGQLGTLDEIAARYGATRVQTALAWLLARSPVTLAIPGTASLAHLEENLAAARLDLTADDVAVLDGLA
ncbi:oxidoreductase [Planomonospora sp. ID91781]|uniref:oxidoreductase n=1 Tax=Planomonospora sp. ID91781 TaxID=2738135 RepID=UPI0018C44946|nr:oxidoreductase [Planomonospora sp. ID91781]MBG0822356.1 oxidoreductase [Planomonospora sp. ID91781]